MNAHRLADDIRDAQAILQRLLQSLEEARNHSDAFDKFLFRERRGYRLQSDFDRSKSGKRTKEWTESSYMRAISAGFKGDYHAWMHVLRAYTPAVASPTQT